MNSGFSSPMDLFDVFFGGGGGGRARKARGEHVVHRLSVSLEELYKGTSRKLALQKNIVCDKCEGEIIFFFSIADLVEVTGIEPL